MKERRVSFTELAKVTGSNVKTAQRWYYEGRRPKPTSASVIAKYLATDANWLWPARRSAVNPELINLYANIAEVPASIWGQSVYEARHVIEVATGPAPSLPRHLIEDLWAKAGEGVGVRVCVGSPVQRDLNIDIDLIRICVHPLAVSIYRFDDHMLVWLGRPDSRTDHSAPVLHLRRCEENGVFDFYRDLFARTWTNGERLANSGKDWYRCRS